MSKAFREAFGKFVGFNYAQEQPPNYSGFVVIGAGLPRTGTMSLRAALGDILDGQVYHMLNVAHGEPDDVVHWDKAMKGELTKKEWINFLQGKGFRAGVDYPISIFYKELMKAFPDAKVVLTVRDPKRWYESVKNSILKNRAVLDDFAGSIFLTMIGGFKYLNMVNQISNHKIQGFKHGMFDTIEAGEAEAIAFFDKWVDEVKRTVPPEKLLVFQVKEGWEPLCKFLDLPIPDYPFPNVNEKEAMSKVLGNVLRISYFVVYGLPLLITLALTFRFFYN